MKRIGKHLTATLLLLLLLLAAAASSALALEFGVKELDNEKIAVNFSREVFRGDYGIVTTDELKTWLDEKKAMLVVDTMPFEASYKKNHIPGAVPFEFPIPEMTEMEAAQKTAFEKLLGPDKDRLIVFYCGFTKCTRSHNGALWAKKLGYTNVYRQPGGIKGWMEADYPVGKVD